MQTQPAKHVYSLTIKNKTGQGIYLKKTGDGITGNLIARVNYLGAKIPKANLIGVPYCTIDDPNVEQDYHDAFIPKAVKYSAGLLDYFFRGTMDVTIPGYDTNAPTFTNVVLNTSGQDFHDGTFYLFKEANGIRSLIHTEPWTDKTLTNGTSTNIICSEESISLTNKYLLVYQGTIGWSNDAALDPVDANIGIAAATPMIEQIKTYTYQPTLAGLGLTNGSTIISNLDSDDFDFVPGRYEVIVNQAYFDDNGAIGCDVDGNGGVLAPLTATNDCGWPHTPLLNTAVPAKDVTIVGNHLHVNITATDNYCGDQIGWVDVSITWRAWPVP